MGAAFCCKRTPMYYRVRRSIPMERELEEEYEILYRQYFGHLDKKYRK